MVGTLTNLLEIGADVRRLIHDQQQLRDRLDYLTVAVARGDPRFTRDAYADPSFDADAFDRWWAGRGRRVPSITECLGEV